jgi:hypothetical protein
MKERAVTMPQIGLIAVTRVAFGIGIGLLLSGKLDEGARRGEGWALLTVGAVTTFPLIPSVVRAPSTSREKLAS